MTEMVPDRRTLRSVGALFAGLVAVVLLSVGTDAVMEATGVFPPMGRQPPMSAALFALATAYRTLFNVVGGYLAARLAPNRPLQHALWLGYIGIVLGMLGVVVTWNAVPSLGPHWYPISLVVLAVPSCWAGGKLFVKA